MSTKSLLVELCVEELPPKALKKLGLAFATLLADALKAQGLAAADARVTPFASPRRLAVHVTQVAARGLDKVVQQKLVPVGIGLDAAGQPTAVLLKKLAGLGVDASAVPHLQRKLDGKQETLFLEKTVPGTTLADGLQQALDEALLKLPIPKVMTYQLADGWKSVKFVRPAHRLVALHGSDVVPIAALGLAAGRETTGHRFEASHPVLTIRDADGYSAQLESEGGVIASFAARGAELARQLQQRAAAERLVPIDDAALLDEVTALVERPNVLLCRFPDEFLAVPPECLILTMKQNQKYFPLLDAQGKLTNRFLIVSNIRPTDPTAVVSGNERVVRPRLADAKFFFDQDRKKTLASRVEGLAKVVYHNKLGSQGERVERVRSIARRIAFELGGQPLRDTADRAAQLAKADLLTDMVGEFPELQGIMGGYYAAHDGEPAEVARAIEDHYKPRFAGDTLPRDPAGIATALADKLDTLVGLFGIGQVPTGDKDPFGLRRHALGVIRMLAEHEKLGLREVLGIASDAFRGAIQDPTEALVDFVFDRLAGMSKDQGFTAQEIDAVLSKRPERLADVRKTLDAVREFAKLPEAAALAAANKRIGNILKKSEQQTATLIDANLMTEPAEIELNRVIESVRPGVLEMYESGRYQDALRACASLKGPIDAFFDKVMVNVDDAACRRNRLRLLEEFRSLMNRVADLSRLAPA